MKLSEYDEPAEFGPITRESKWSDRRYAEEQTKAHADEIHAMQRAVNTVRWWRRHSDLLDRSVPGPELNLVPTDEFKNKRLWKDIMADIDEEERFARDRHKAYELSREAPAPYREYKHPGFKPVAPKYPVNSRSRKLETVEDILAQDPDEEEEELYRDYQRLKRDREIGTLLDDEGDESETSEHRQKRYLDLLTMDAGDMYPEGDKKPKRPKKDKK